jgi:hypothetical protein
MNKESWMAVTSLATGHLTRGTAMTGTINPSGICYQIPPRIAAAASANTWQPSTMSASRVFSA